MNRGKHVVYLVEVSDVAHGALGIDERPDHRTSCQCHRVRYLVKRLSQYIH